jgi:hypothetical protein
VPTRSGTLETLGEMVAKLLAPLAEELNSGNVLDFFRRLGLQFPDVLLTAHPQLVSALDDASGAAGVLPAAIEQLRSAISGGNNPAILTAGAEVVGRIVAVVERIANVKNKLDAAANSTPGVTPQQIHDFAGALPRAILDYLIVRAGEDFVPTITSLLVLVGLIDRQTVAAAPGDNSKPEHVARRLRFDRLGDFLSSPLEYAENLTGWGANGFNGSDLLQRVQDFLDERGLASTLGGAPLRLESSAFDLALNPATTPPGLSFEAHLPVEAGIDLRLPMCPGYALHILTEGSFAADFTGTITPPAEVTAQAATELSGRLLVGFSAERVAPATAIILFGQTGGSRVEVQSVLAEAGLSFRAAGGAATVEPIVRGSITGGKVVIDTSNADGFIAMLTSGLHVESGFNVVLGWSPSTGVRFEGSATIEIQIPLHVSLGPVEISSLYLVTGLSASGAIPVELSVGLGATLGPLQASVDRIGALAEITFPPGGGNIGAANLKLKFKPPNGVGLAVDAGVVKGGGYLYIDAERGEYAGALELTFSGFISLKAIGLITTKMPDGSPGFSLLIIITAEFATGIQLGFGFTLLAVGGLLGLNRTMRLQPLMEGVRTGALNSIMFPQNVIANAPKIISDLRTIFPPQQGIFLIGPMAKLGWGTPTLISVSLGIIIEIPGNIAILGVLRVALPTEAAPILLLQVNFAGAIEFDKKRLYFFASLFESRVLFITIEGEMGLLVAWGDDANFVVSVGGFHPRFSPPPLPFPSPRRVALNLINESFARIRVEGYFAITSNTVQFGSRTEVYFGLDVANVSGHFGYDALFQLSPFHFIVTLSASFSVKAFGFGLFSVSFDGSLEGPTPWRIAGTGSISLLFFDIDIDFEVTWGESRNTSLPPIKVLPLLKAEFEKVENWQALPPTNRNLLVTLRKLPAEEPLVLHPVGVLKISQRGLPLALTLDKVGSQKPSDVNKLSVAVGGGGLERKGDTREQFAPAQFQNMSDSEKLSRPAFAPELAGLELSAAGAVMRSSGMTRRVVRYEEIIIDSNFKRFVRRFKLFGSLLFDFFLAGSSVTLAEVSMAKRKQYQPFADKVEVQAETYTVAFQSNNQAFAAASFHSEASAREFMNQQVASDAGLSDQLHVIPSFERAA